MNAPLRQVEFIHGLNAPREQFIENIKANIESHGVPSLRIRRAMLVGGGPSAADHLKDIRRLKYEGWELFTVNGSHDWLIREGIFPTGCVLMDATPIVDTFVQKPQNDCTYYLASQLHPSLFSRLVKGGYRCAMFHAQFDNPTNDLIETLDPSPTIFAPAPTVALHALSVLYTLGVRKLNVYGLDSSHRDGADHAYDNSQQKHVDELEFYFKGERFLATGTWASQAECFARFWPVYFKIGMRIEVFGDGLLPAMARHAKETLMQELQAKQMAIPQTEQ